MPNLIPQTVLDQTGAFTNPFTTPSKKVDSAFLDLWCLYVQGSENSVSITAEVRPEEGAPWFPFEEGNGGPPAMDLMTLSASEKKRRSLNLSGSPGNTKYSLRAVPEIRFILDFNGDPDGATFLKMWLTEARG